MQPAAPGGVLRYTFPTAPRISRDEPGRLVPASMDALPGAIQRADGRNNPQFRGTVRALLPGDSSFLAPAGGLPFQPAGVPAPASALPFQTPQPSFPQQQGGLPFHGQHASQVATPPQPPMVQQLLATPQPPMVQQPLATPQPPMVQQHAAPQAAATPVATLPRAQVAAPAMQVAPVAGGFAPVAPPTGGAREGAGAPTPPPGAVRATLDANPPAAPAIVAPYALAPTSAPHGLSEEPSSQAAPAPMAAAPHVLPTPPAAVAPPAMAVPIGAPMPFAPGVPPPGVGAAAAMGPGKQDSPWASTGSHDSPAHAAPPVAPPVAPPAAATAPLVEAPSVRPAAPRPASGGGGKIALAVVAVIVLAGAGTGLYIFRGKLFADRGSDAPIQLGAPSAASVADDAPEASASTPAPSASVVARPHPKAGPAPAPKADDVYDEGPLRREAERPAPALIPAGPPGAKPGAPAKPAGPPQPKYDPSGI